MNQFTFKPDGRVTAKILQRVKYRFVCPKCGLPLETEIDWPEGLTLNTHLNINSGCCPRCGSDVSKQPQGRYSVVNGELIRSEVPVPDA